MKKLLFVTIFVLASLYAYSQDAFIDQLTGTVEIRQPKENSFKAATKGEKIFQETVISTSFKSFAIVKIGSTTITIRPLTTLSLTEIQKQERIETINVNLQSGRVRVDVKPPVGTKAATTLTLPSSVASVRGTSFELDTHNLYVNEGTVSFIGNRGQTILVRAGESSRVEHTGLATTPRDERNLILMPPNPVGVSVIDVSAFGVNAQGKNFSLKLVFN